MNPSPLLRLVKSSDQVDTHADPDKKDNLPLGMPSSPVWETGGPAAVSTGLPEELGSWGGWADFLPFLAIFFKKRFIGVVCRSEHVGRGSELKISRTIPSHHPIERPCQSRKAGAVFFVLKSETSKNHMPPLFPWPSPLVVSPNWMLSSCGISHHSQHLWSPAIVEHSLENRTDYPIPWNGDNRNFFPSTPLRTLSRACHQGSDTFSDGTTSVFYTPAYPLYFFKPGSPTPSAGTRPHPEVIFPFPHILI